MNKYSSTLIRYFDRNCPKALDFYEQEMRADESMFSAGITAHAIMERVGKNKDANKEDIIKAAVHELCTKEREFRGRKSPPLPLSDALRGAEIAEEFLACHELPEQGRYEVEFGMTVAGFFCSPEYEKCRYIARMDVLEYMREGFVSEDDEECTDVIITTDYKTQWNADKTFLDSLQIKGQAVLAAKAYPEANAVCRQVVNMRTMRTFRETIYLDEEGRGKLDKWATIILDACDIMDEARIARPGLGCIDCPYINSCEDAYNAAFFADYVNAETYAASKAISDYAASVLKESLKDKPPQECKGGSVGYKNVTGMTPSDKAIDLILDNAWRHAESRDIAIGLLKMVSLTSSNIKAFARNLKKEGISPKEFLDEALTIKASKRFGIWKDKEINDE